MKPIQRTKLQKNTREQSQGASPRELPACRVCGGETFLVLDLGLQPFANALVTQPEEDVTMYPLMLVVCRQSSTAQLSFCADDKVLYENYFYITPESRELQQHYKEIYDFLTQRNCLKSTSSVLEIGSNIGRLLEFLRPQVSSVLGVDPAMNICEMANQRGILTVPEFFNAATARWMKEEHGCQDIIFARHCFAHNEKPWLMLEGANEILSDDGTVVIENAYFLDTVRHYEFDQIYHEHMYYYNLRSMTLMLNRHGFKLVDVLHSPIHGGSVMYVAKRLTAGGQPSDTVQHYLDLEADMHREDFYRDFVSRIQENKKRLIKILQELKTEGKEIHAYGASAKSTTLLNYFGIDHRLISSVVDSTVTKQGKYIPLANVRIISEEEAARRQPDYYLLTIWNYKDEIIHKVRSWGNRHTKFIIPHPRVQIIEP